MIISPKGPAVLILPDGNRRWDKLHNVPPAEAYVAMARTIATTIDELRAHGINRAYFAANSVGNLSRPAAEVDAFFRAFWRVPEFTHTKARFTLRGNLKLLPPAFQPGFDQLVASSAANDEFELFLMINWSMDDEIIRLFELSRKLTGPISVEQMMEHSDIKEPIDLIVRTGGRRRLSSFIPWHSPYAEIRFLECLWPDFTPADMREALKSLRESTRTFGH